MFKFTFFFSFAFAYQRDPITRVQTKEEKKNPSKYIDIDLKPTEKKRRGERHGLTRRNKISNYIYI
jgi:hypothetical protein